ncbi:MAG: glycosyl transferase family 1 [Bacteroidetes bacterium]|nr:MAG: glycosyl transferase family 1 [Bacteroidota bacterium]
MYIPLAIVSNNKDKYSETFIHAQINHLPYFVHHLYGDHLPHFAQGKLLNHGRSFAPWLRRPEVRQSRAVAQYLQHHTIRLVLAQYGPAGVAMYPICQRLRLPLLVHFHGYDAYRDDVLHTHGRHYPALFAAATALIVVSEHMREQLLRLGAPADKLHLIPYGIDTEAFQPGPARTGPCVIVSCGRFVAKKGPAVSLQAFAKVRASVPGARLIMVGDGELLPACKQLAHRLGIAEAVEFRGVLTPAEVAQTLQAADIFIQPSLTSAAHDAEGTPLAILEAGACGLPVAASYHGGIPQVVQAGETGLLVAEGDIDGLAQQLIFLAENDTIRKRMGTAARARISTYFTLDRYLADLSQLIDQSLSTD